MEDCNLNCRIEQLQDEQLVNRAKADILKQTLEAEKAHLQFYKDELEKDRQAFIEKMKIWYPEPKPCTCGDTKEPQTCFTEKMGDFNVCIVKKEEITPEDEEKCIKMHWTHEQAEKNDPEAGTRDCLLFMLEKNLIKDKVRLQVENKTLPRQICPCKSKAEGITDPFPKRPHCHTTYIKTDLIIPNIEDTEIEEFKPEFRTRRTERLRNQFEPQVFCRTSN